MEGEDPLYTAPLGRGVDRRGAYESGQQGWLERVGRGGGRRGGHRNGQWVPAIFYGLKS